MNIDLKTYLIDNSITRDNLQQLINLFKKDVFVPFIGAGTSFPLGTPGWNKLFKKIRKQLKMNVHMSRSDDRANYPKLFSKIFKKLGNKKRFYDTLFKNLKPTLTRFTGFHVEIVHAFDAFVTTNYDLPLERAFEYYKNSQLKKYYFTCWELCNLQNCVVYLHGHEDIDFVIIKEEDYQYFYPTVSQKDGIPILESFLKKLYTDKHILFLGFSFNDPYIYNYFAHLSKALPKRNKHFWILDEGTEPYFEIADKMEKYAEKGLMVEAKKVAYDFHKQFAGMDIYPIVYKRGEHIFVEMLLEQLKLMSTELPIQQGKISGQPGGLR